MDAVLYQLAALSRMAAVRRSRHLRQTARRCATPSSTIVCGWRRVDAVARFDSGLAVLGLPGASGVRSRGLRYVEGALPIAGTPPGDAVPGTSRCADRRPGTAALPPSARRPRRDWSACTATRPARRRRRAVRRAETAG